MISHFFSSLVDAEGAVLVRVHVQCDDSFLVLGHGQFLQRCRLPELLLKRIGFRDLQGTNLIDNESIRYVSCELVNALKITPHAHITFRSLTDPPEQLNGSGFR